MANGRLEMYLDDSRATFLVAFDILKGIQEGDLDRIIPEHIHIFSGEQPVHDERKMTDAAIERLVEMGLLTLSFEHHPDAAIYKPTALYNLLSELPVRQIWLLAHGEVLND